MDMNRNANGWEQKLLLTFHARAFDLREMVEDVRLLAPSAKLGCGRDSPRAAGEPKPEVVKVAMELPDDNALLNRVMAVIFHGQGSLQPSVKVLRVLRDRSATSANDSARCAPRRADTASAAAA